MKTMHRQTGKTGQETAEQHRMLPCDRAAEWDALLYDYAEGLTDRETRCAVRRHLRECAYCRGALEDIRVTVSSLRRSVPKPKVNLSARVMEAIRAQEEADGAIIAQNIDLQTGRVVSDHPQTWKWNIRRAVSTLGGIAAALVLVIGLVYFLPFLRTESGAASPTQEILQDIRNEESGFSGGVFFGTQKETEPAFGQYAVVFDISGADITEVLRLLKPLSDGDPSVRIAEYGDGILVSPLSVYRAAAALLDAENLSVLITESDVSHEGAENPDAFYIQVHEP